MSDFLTEDAVRTALPAPYQGISLRVEETVDSTNAVLKRERAQLKNHALLVAGEQTLGRGRLGRSFVSPAGTGFYMSLLFRMPPEHALKLTLACAVAVCQAIEETTPLEPKIKWVNDVFVSGKKVCGILCEAVENDVIAGIGVNVRTPQGGFPKEIAAVAGSIQDALTVAAPPRALLAGKIAGKLLAFSEDLEGEQLMQEYRARSFLIGREITYVRADKSYTAVVQTVAQDGALVVLQKDGTLDALRTGEVSLRSTSFT